jgi:hypothetical protein
MAEAVACEYCGKLVEREHAFTEPVEGWPHYFCSEACEIAWGEQGDLQADEEG